MADNELIAEFMGCKPCVIMIKSVGIFKGFECDYFKLPIDELEYHESWDWLMPVVKKISEIHDSKFNYDFDEIKQGKWPEDNEYMEVIALPLATPIIDAHKAVVQFIKFYNSQK
jgi:hypothetical protein